MAEAKAQEEGLNFKKIIAATYLSQWTNGYKSTPSKPIACLGFCFSSSFRGGGNRRRCFSSNRSRAVRERAYRRQRLQRCRT